MKKEGFIIAMQENSLNKDIEYFHDVVCYLNELKKDTTVPEPVKSVVDSAVCKYIEQRFFTSLYPDPYRDRHAWWVEGDEIYSNCCSNCCKYHLFKTDYCPNCGFKMDKLFGSDKAKQIARQIFIHKKLKMKIHNE